MAAVDVLPPVLGRLLLVEEPDDREAPTAKTLLGVVHHGGDAVSMQPVGAREPREASTNDDHGASWGARRLRWPPQGGRAQRPRADHDSTAQQLAAIDPGTGGGGIGGIRVALHRARPVPAKRLRGRRGGGSGEAVIRRGKPAHLSDEGGSKSGHDESSSPSES